MWVRLETFSMIAFCLICEIYMLSTRYPQNADMQSKVLLYYYRNSTIIDTANQKYGIFSYSSSWIESGNYILGRLVGIYPNGQSLSFHIEKYIQMMKSKWTEKKNKIKEWKETETNYRQNEITGGDEGVLEIRRTPTNNRQYIVRTICSLDQREGMWR